MKTFKFKIEGNDYEVAVNKKDGNLAEVTVNGKTLSVEMEGKAKSQVAKPAVSAPKAAPKAKPAAAPAKAAAPKAAANANSVTAPLPGTIFKIVASTGQAVKKGEVLLVMEAMKMENNILAAKDGTVKTIHVQLGQTVLPGDALVDVE